MSRYQSVRLFCLPYAGGTARIFAGWAADLPSWIDVVPLELPGHGFRFDEPVCDDLTQLVADLRDQVLARLDRRYAVFGHSLGALLGYELIQVLQGKDEPAVHFFPSGAGAPHIPTRNPAAGYSAEELRAHIAELGGTPRELVENDELMELMYPVLRADFLLADTYRAPARAALDCPATAFCGTRDTEASAADVLAWRLHVRGPFSVRLLEGDHFFVQSARRDLLTLIASTLHPEHAETPAERGAANR
ncbi:MAG TPA: alpha/beta fold hydrolase [Amycolatopsis sp.]|nr:alpha/beta fold hydrolase [Amycolatopsis sp.]